MAEFMVKPDLIKKNASSEEAICSKVDALGRRIRTVSQRLRLGASVGKIVRLNLNALAEKTEDHAGKIKKLSDTLDAIALNYNRTERAIQNQESWSDATDIWSDFIKFITPYYITQFLGNKDKLAVSVIGASAAKTGSFLGIPMGFQAEGDLLGASLKNKKTAEWDLEKGDAKIEAGVEGELYAAKGKLKGNIGLFGGEVEGSLGTISGAGMIGATLFSDGKFSPSAIASAKAEAAVAKVETEGRFGTEENNLHVNGKGTLLGAEAKAEAGIGFITYENETTGKTATEFGVAAEAGAEAYVAEGEISGGFTLFGVNVDAGIEGKAGGAGAKAEARITTGGASGEIGAGLGLGLGIKVSIDWSDFSLW